MSIAAAASAPARSSSRAIAALTRAALNESLLCANQLGGWANHRLGPGLLEWASKFWGVRSLGGCLDAMLVASGRAEVWIEPKLQAWDMAGPRVILEEAGARRGTI